MVSEDATPSGENLTNPELWVGATTIEPSANRTEDLVGTEAGSGFERHPRAL